jgi:hypothetical protein
MDTGRIISELRMERGRINRVIVALELLNGAGKPAPAARRVTLRVAHARKAHLSAAARRRISELLKKRWAQRKRQGKNRL